MATVATTDTPEGLDYREQLTRIDHMLVDIQRKQQEIQLAPWQVFSTLIAGAAGFAAAGAALVKIFG